MITSETVRSDGTEKVYLSLITDGNKGRLDLVNASGKKEGLSAITQDSGKTSVLSDQKESLCSKWSSAELAQEIGNVLSKATKMARADISDVKVEKTTDEPGPEMIGHPTRHLALHTTYAFSGKVVLKKIEYAFVENDELWMAPNLPMEPMARELMRVLARTGFDEVDDLATQTEAELKGSTLLWTSSVNMKDQVSGKSSTKKQRVEVTAREEINAAELPADTFAIDGNCRKISDKERKKETQNMILRHVK